MIVPEALRHAVTVLLGIAPFAVTIGIALRRLDISHPLGMTASGLIYSGSAQLAAIKLMDGGAGVAAVLLAVVMINARLLMYGAGLEPLFRRHPAWFRWIAPQFIIDQTYVLATGGPGAAETPAGFRRYWFTLGIAIGVGWVGTIGATLALGPLLSANSPLDFAPVALFIGMLVPRLNDRRAMVAAGGAALASTLAVALPSGMGLLLGVLVGMTLGALPRSSS